MVGGLSCLRATMERARHSVGLWLALRKLGPTAGDIRRSRSQQPRPPSLARYCCAGLDTVHARADARSAAVQDAVMVDDIGHDQVVEAPG